MKNTNKLTASQLMEALKNVPCDAEVYLFCGHNHGPLNAISVNTNNSVDLTPSMPKQAVVHNTYVSLSCRNPVDELNPDGVGCEPSPKGNPEYN